MVNKEAAISEGTVEEVDFVDDIGSIHMKWKNGRGLALIPGVDKFRKMWRFPSVSI